MLDFIALIIGYNIGCKERPFRWLFGLFGRILLILLVIGLLWYLSIKIPSTGSLINLALVLFIGYRIFKVMSGRK